MDSSRTPIRSVQKVFGGDAIWLHLHGVNPSITDNRTGNDCSPLKISAAAMANQ